MPIDHIAWPQFPGYPRDPLPMAMHILGRLTCPNNTAMKWLLYLYYPLHLFIIGWIQFVR